MLLTGKEFTNHYNKSDTKFYKILKEDLIHNNYQFVNGINIDPIPFNPDGECSKGGFYFTEYNKIACWLEYTDDLTYIADVKIPDNAQVYVEENKFKADKFILNLNNKIDIKDHECWNNAEFCEMAVQQDGCALKYVINQTEELCKMAVQRDGYALKYVNNQTEDICKLAVQQNGLALQYVNIPQTEALCKLAVQQNGFALQYVTIPQTEALCKLAIQQTDEALYFVKEQTEEICKFAVQQNRDALYYVKDNLLRTKLHNDMR